MKESEIEEILRKGIKKLGGRAYKWKSPGNNGVPDRIVFLPNKNPIFVELKTEKGVTSAVQKIQIKRLCDLGQDVRILYGIHDVNQFLLDCGRSVNGI